MDRADGFYPSGWGFKSLRACQLRRCSLRDRRSPSKRSNVGSNPTSGTSDILMCMKECTRCKQFRDYTEFSKKKTTKDGFQHVCKACHTTYLKSHYSNNKSYYKKKATVRNKEVRLENLQFTFNYLKEHPCVDCGETDPLVLEFDHIKNKRKAVSKLVALCVSIETIKQEIAKCEVRCCNCHRRKTIKQLGWYRDIQL